MNHRIAITPSTLARQIAALSETPPATLKQRWRTLYGTEPPRRISRELLVRALAYRLQEKKLGGLKPATRRLLTKIAADASAHRDIRIRPEPILKPGTVLLREWHGTQHQVLVGADGIVFEGQSYRSLSQIARGITGARWSGPRFFGLRAKRQEHSDGAS